MTVARKPPAAGKGRPKGALNKTTVAAREAFQLAFDSLDGPDGLAAWARDNQTEFYKLYGRLIPVDVNANHGVQDGLGKLLEEIAANGRPRPR